MRKTLLSLVTVTSLISLGLSYPQAGKVGTVAWYSTEACKNPACLTASGRSLYALEAQKISFIATYHYPVGALVKVVNVSNGKGAFAIVADRGPHPRLRRIADVSKATAALIGFDLRKGLTTATITLVPMEGSIHDYL